MNKPYDRVEVLESNTPNYKHTTTNFFLGNELVKKSFVDEEEDKTEYFKNNKLHNGEEPAVVIKDDSGFQFKYYDSGVLHGKEGQQLSLQVIQT